MEVTPQDEVEEIAQLVSIVHKQPEDHSTSTTTDHFLQTKSDASLEDNARINNDNWKRNSYFCLQDSQRDVPP